MNTSCDIIIIGGGPGGIAAASEAAKHGLRVTVIEKGALGGTCVHEGCLPYTLFIERVRSLSSSFNFLTFKNELTILQEQQSGAIRAEFSHLGIEVLESRALILSKSEVLIADGRTLRARFILIASGAEKHMGAFAPTPLENLYHAENFLQTVSSHPSSAIIIGGGTAGLELADSLASLGTKVTILEARERICPTSPAFAGGRLQKALEKKGIIIHTNAVVTGIQSKGNMLVCSYQGSEDLPLPTQACAQAVIIATGRKKNAVHVFESAEAARKLGVSFHEGAVCVDDEGNTGCDSIYALGDAIDGTDTAHRARSEGIHIAQKIAALCRGAVPQGVTRPLVQPLCIRTNPELAWIGLSPEDAKDANRSTINGRSWTQANMLAAVCNDTSGFIHLVFEKKKDGRAGLLQGAQILCERSMELIGEVALAIAGGLDAATLAKAIHPHPSYSELLASAAQQALSAEKDITQTK